MKSLTLSSCTVHFKAFRTNDALIVSPCNENHLSVGIEQKGFFRSTDGSASRQRSEAGLKPCKLAGGGVCWDEFTGGVVAPSNPSRVYVLQGTAPGDGSHISGLYGDLYVSTNGGASFEYKPFAGV